MFDLDAYLERIGLPGFALDGAGRVVPASQDDGAELASSRRSIAAR